MGGDGEVGIVHHRDQGFVEVPIFFDEVQVQSLALALAVNDAIFPECCFHELVIGHLAGTLSKTHWV